MLKAANLALGLLLVSGAVFAQPTAPAPTPAPSPAAPAPPPGGAPPAIDLRVQQRSNLTEREMTDGASEYRNRILQIAARIDQLLKEARDQKDIIRINCLQDKLVQVRASTGVVDKSFATMQESLSRADRGSALHEYTRITIVNQNAQVLAGEAEACVGEELSYIGATKVDVENANEGAPDPFATTPSFPSAPPRPESATPYI